MSHDVENEGHLKLAAEYWERGQSIEAGRVIYENLSQTNRPRWAANILRVVLDASGVHSLLFSQLLTIADHHDMWPSSHQMFSNLRLETIKYDELRRRTVLSYDDECLSSVILLAELVAKVIYNATNPPDEFDEDSGWWLVACTRGFVDHGSFDQHFPATVWSALTSFLPKSQNC